MQEALSEWARRAHAAVDEQVDRDLGDLQAKLDDFRRDLDDVDLPELPEVPEAVVPTYAGRPAIDRL